MSSDISIVSRLVEVQVRLKGIMPFLAYLLARISVRPKLIFLSAPCRFAIEFLSDLRDAADEVVCLFSINWSKEP